MKHILIARNRVFDMKLIVIFIVLSLLLLQGCAQYLETSIVSGDAYGVTVHAKETSTLFTGGQDTDGADLLAITHCGQYGKTPLLLDTDVIPVSGGLAWYNHRIYDCMTDQEFKAAYDRLGDSIWSRVVDVNRTLEAAGFESETPDGRSQAREKTSDSDQCKAFGFTDGTPEMANCLLELYKIANQSQQSTQTIGDLYPEATRGNTPDPAAAIELFNISRDILNNTGTRAAPAPTSVRCTKFGDFSGQVYTFNIACPMGYVQSF